MLTSLKNRFLAVARWTGEAGHRRAIAGIASMVIAHGLAREVSSSTIDDIIYIVDAAILAAWTGSDREVSE